LKLQQDSDEVAAKQKALDDQRAELLHRQKDLETRLKDLDSNATFALQQQEDKTKLDLTLQTVCIFNFNQNWVHYEPKRFFEFF